MRVIEAAGSLQVALNPITTAAMVKRISAVAVAERVTLSPAEAKSLAESANGDLRNALETLQLLCGGQSAKSALLSNKVIAIYNPEKEFTELCLATIGSGGGVLVGAGLSGGNPVIVL